MQVTETVNEGLKRSLKVVVDASELERDFSSRLGELSGQVRLKGFRPGKVPVNHLRRIYGKSVMAEVVQKKVDDSSKMALAERQLKPAYSPQIDLPQDQGEIEKMMDGTGDLAFTMTFEIVPPIEVKDFATLEVEKLTVDVTDQQVDDALGRIAAQNIEFETKPDGDAQKGDRVMLSFVGKIDAEAFEGGSADDVPLVLGSGQFLPGFEDQLIGAKAGETRLVKTEFPADYSVEKLAGKPAEFEVSVKSVDAPKQAEINDALAQKLGLENLDALKTNVKARLGAEFAQMSAMKLKRDILDQLDAQYNFELPQRLVDGEFNQIWAALQREMQQSGRSFADENTTEEEARTEYQAIANRRVRLGLLLGTVGEQAGVTISDEEMQRARQFPGQERRVIDYYRKNANALIELRGPVFEQKVIDYILAQAKVTEKKVTREELAKAVEEDQEFHPVGLPHDHGDHDHHDHDHAHGHEHGHDHDHEHNDHDHHDHNR
jgi:trigger factor